jgi:predicted AAA+ superfamily ATPase
VLNTIVVRDIAPRQDSFTPALFDNVLRFMFDNVGNLASTNNISNTMTSLGRKTGRTAVDTYVSAMTAAYLLYKARRYDLRGKAYLENSAKYYVVDLGMRRALLGGRHPDLGHTLENVVFLELMRRHETVHVGKLGTSEIDFVAEGAAGLEYFQVCQSVTDPAVLARELAPLRAIRDNYPRWLLVGEDSLPADHGGIRQASVRDWALGRGAIA